MLDTQTTELGATVSQSNAETTISAILSYVLSGDLPSRTPVVDLNLFGVRDAAQIISLLPGFDIETAASYNWQRISTSRDPDAQAEEYKEALAALDLLKTRKLPEDLADKVWEDAYVLRRRMIRLFRMQCDIRFESERWSRDRIEQWKDDNCKNLSEKLEQEADPELRYLIFQQIAQFHSLTEEALAL
jgi:hypothetical protein